METIKPLLDIFPPGGIISPARIRFTRAGLTASGYIKPYTRLDFASLAKLIHALGACDGSFHSAMIYANDRKLEAVLKAGPAPQVQAWTEIAKILEDPAERAKVVCISVQRDVNAITTVLYNDDTYKVFPRYCIAPPQDQDAGPATIFTRDLLDKFASILKPSARYETA